VAEAELGDLVGEEFGIDLRGLVPERARYVACAARLREQQREAPSQTPTEDELTTLDLEQILCHCPACAFAPEQAVGRDLDIVEKHLVDFVVAGHHADRAHPDAGRTQVDQHEAQRVFAVLALRAQQTENLVRKMRIGSPNLGAIDDIGIAAPFGESRDRSEIRARARLGEALAPLIVALDNSRQQIRLLRGCAECHDHRTDIADAQW